MGNWNISIRGVGVHHNKNLPHDANRMAVTFVKMLRDAGHTVTAAEITYGGAEDIAHPEAASTQAALWDEKAGAK